MHLCLLSQPASIAYFQKMGGEAYILVADLEAEATRGVSLEQARKRALDFHIPAYIALGLDPKETIFYFQSDNVEVTRATALFSKKVTLTSDVLLVVSFVLSLSLSIATT